MTDAELAHVDRLIARIGDNGIEIAKLRKDRDAALDAYRKESK